MNKLTKKCPVGCKCQDHCGRCGDKVGKDKLRRLTNVDSICEKCYYEIYGKMFG